MIKNILYKKIIVDLGGCSVLKPEDTSWIRRGYESVRSECLFVAGNEIWSYTLTKYSSLCLRCTARIGNNRNKVNFRIWIFKSPGVNFEFDFPGGYRFTPSVDLSNTECAQRLLINQLDGKADGNHRTNAIIKYIRPHCDSHFSPLAETIQIRRSWHSENCRGYKDVTNVILWATAHGYTNDG